MDKWQAVHSFWSSFDLPAYDDNSIPENVHMPYITYSAAVGGFEDSILLSASIWYYSTSWEEISQKADEIAESIPGYRLIQMGDHEYLMITKGSPFAQRMSSDNDDMNVKRMYIQAYAEFLSKF